jgi:hypothetical protein
MVLLGIISPGNNTPFLLAGHKFDGRFWVIHKHKHAVIRTSAASARDWKAENNFRSRNPLSFRFLGHV